MLTISELRTKLNETRSKLELAQSREWDEGRQRELIELGRRLDEEEMKLNRLELAIRGN